MSQRRFIVGDQPSSQQDQATGEGEIQSIGEGHPPSRKSTNLPTLPLPLARMLLVVGFLALLEVAVRVGIISAFFMPPPSEFLTQAARGLISGGYLALAGVTLLTTGVAFLIASAVGLTVGFLLWYIKQLGEAYDPLVAGLFSSPIILLYPISLVLFGRSASAAIAVAVLFGVLPIILYTRQALSSVRPILLKVGNSMQLSLLANFRHILLPAAAPTIFTGLRLGMVFMLKVVVTMEYVAQIGGLGNLVSESSLLFRAEELYAGVTFVILVSATFIYLTYQLEKMVK